MTRRFLHYLTACLVIVLYGGQVCPFLESLTLSQLALPVMVLFLLLFSLQVLVTDRLIARGDYRYQSRRLFQWELSLFLAIGFLAAVFNTIYYAFPMASGLKYLVALGILGFFSAVDLSLEREWQLSQYFTRGGKQITLDEHYFSQPKKLGLFSSVIICLILGAIFLIIIKDMDWLASVGEGVPIKTAQRAILAELAFIAAVILCHIFNLVHSYSRNLKNFLLKETHALQRATSGDFNAFVPVSSNDEFGIMAQYTNIMVEGLKRRTEELQQTQDTTILTLASLAETRDNETGNHILRTQRYVKVLAEALKKRPGYEAKLDLETIDLLFKSAPLHDIGKVGIPDHILLKPGKLDRDEFEIMKGHAQLGADALEIAEKRLGRNSFLRLARQIALAHHEKWDGSGYPNGLKGEDIPLAGRLMAVADVYDALISKRIYKPAFSHQKASTIIGEGAATHFDPAIVETFHAIHETFQQIAREYRDSGEEA